MTGGAARRCGRVSVGMFWWGWADRPGEAMEICPFPADVPLTSMSDINGSGRRRQPTAVCATGTRRALARSSADRTPKSGCRPAGGQGRRGLTDQFWWVRPLRLGRAGLVFVRTREDQSRAEADRSQSFQCTAMTYPPNFAFPVPGGTEHTTPRRNGDADRRDHDAAARLNQELMPLWFLMFAMSLRGSRIGSVAEDTGSTARHTRA